MKGFALRGASLLGAGRCTPGRARCTAVRELNTVVVVIAAVNVIVLNLLILKWDRLCYWALHTSV